MLESPGDNLLISDVAVWMTLLYYGLGAAFLIKHKSDMRKNMYLQVARQRWITQIALPDGSRITRIASKLHVPIFTGRSPCSLPPKDT
jgi:hypothetical protein